MSKYRVTCAAGDGGVDGPVIPSQQGLFNSSTQVQQTVESHIRKSTKKNKIYVFQIIFSPNYDCYVMVIGNCTQNKNQPLRYTHVCARALHILHIYMCKYSTYIRTYIRICIHTYICTYVHTYIHNVHTYIHTYVRTYIPVHAYVRTVHAYVRYASLKSSRIVTKFYRITIVLRSYSCRITIVFGSYYDRV